MSSSVEIQRVIQLLHHNKPTFISSLQHLFQIHTQLITASLHSHTSSLPSLFQTYPSNPSILLHAATIFNRIQEPTSQKWRLMIRKHVSDGYPLKAVTLFSQMLLETNNQINDPFIYASLIKACNQIGDALQGKSVHCHVLKSGLDGHLNISNSLIHFYSNAGSLRRYACMLFDKTPEKTTVTINCMVSGYLRKGLFYLGLDLFIYAWSGCFGLSAMPNHVTLVVLISGSVEYGKLDVGTSLHSCCCKMGFDSNKEVSNVLINLYTRSGCMNDALKLFTNMAERDLVSWNTMIASYVKNNEPRKAILLFREMRRRLVEVDRVSLISLISASANSKGLDTGKMIHGHIKGSGIDITVPLGTALINMYSKCGAIEFARKVFSEMPKENIASWNSLIHGFVECGLSSEALRLFNMTQSLGLKADDVTILGLILACRDSGGLNEAIQVHSYVKSRDCSIQSNLLCNALIDMYAKCGSMSRAKLVFDKMSSRDVITWTSIIMGYAINGKGEKALTAFNQMLSANILPNSVTFIAVLSACNHAGLVDYGQTLYDAMQKIYHINPVIEHCGCMVDMQARAGMLEEAHQFVKSMPVEPNAIIWRMLINACRVHSHCNLGLSLVNGIMEVRQSCGSEDHVIFSNIFAEAGKWDDVLLQRSLMKIQGTSKVAGRSLVSCIGDES